MPHFPFRSNGFEHVKWRGGELKVPFVTDMPTFQTLPGSLFLRGLHLGEMPGPPGIIQVAFLKFVTDLGSGIT